MACFISLPPTNYSISKCKLKIYLYSPHYIFGLVYLYNYLNLSLDSTKSNYSWNNLTIITSFSIVVLINFGFSQRQIFILETSICLNPSLYYQIWNFTFVNFDRSHWLRPYWKRYFLAKGDTTSEAYFQRIISYMIFSKTTWANVRTLILVW